MIFNVDDDLHLLAGPYVLDAVDDIDRHRFERHLESCGSCRDEVASFRATVDELALAAAEPPPAGLKSKVMSEVHQTRQISIGASTRGTALRAGLARKSLAAAAAVVVLAAVGVVLVQQDRRSDRNEQAAAILRAPDVQLVAVSGTAGGRLIFAGSVGAGVFTADGLAAAPAGRTYQLWIIQAGTPRPIGTFDVNTKQHAELRVSDLPAPGSLIAVTEEPAGGSTQPTTQPILISAPI